MSDPLIVRVPEARTGAHDGVAHVDELLMLCECCDLHLADPRTMTCAVKACRYRIIQGRAHVGG